jgi:CRP-like cAMP-binding protein
LIDFYIKKVIQHLCFFQDVEKNFTAQIALRLKPSFFPPFNVIIQIEEIGTEMFIISKGCVEVFLTINKQQQEEQERSVCMLFDGDFFGEMAFCMDPIHSLRMANVRSKTYCELHTLDYSSLQEAIERFPLVKKKLFTTAHTRHALLNNLQKTKVDLLFHKHHPHHHGKASSSSSSSPLKGHLHHGQL